MISHALTTNYLSKMSEIFLKRLRNIQKEWGIINNILKPSLVQEHTQRRLYKTVA
jgi:hypothetical protein